MGTGATTSESLFRPDHLLLPVLPRSATSRPSSSLLSCLHTSYPTWQLSWDDGYASILFGLLIWKACSPPMIFIGFR
jgi:hypothetical protein